MNLIDPLSGGYSTASNYLSLVVVIYWLKPAFLVMKKFMKGKKLYHYDYLIWGVWVAFLGDLTNGIYWQAFWVFKYHENDIHYIMYNSGTLFNVFSRQTSVTLAAYSHIRGALLFEGREEIAKKHVAFAVIIGVIYSFYMLMTRPL